MIFVSLANTNTTPNFDKEYKVYTSTSNDQEFSHYDFAMYNKFKSHWKNGVKMFADYGQQHLACNSSIVCAGVDNFDFTELIDKLEKSPNNTIVFHEGREVATDVEFPIMEGRPVGYPTFFACRYSTFMHYVSLWKWIESHHNQPELLKDDAASNSLCRTVCLRNLQYTILHYND